MTIKIRKTTDAITPTRGSNGAAGYDLYATEGAGIMPGKSAIFGTGIAMEIPEGYFGAIFARSGLATKRGLRPTTCVSVIDCDYRNEIFVGLYNDSDMPEIIDKGDRIAQIVFLPYQVVDFVEADLTETERGLGEFGSTGK